MVSESVISPLIRLKLVKSYMVYFHELRMNLSLSTMPCSEKLFHVWVSSLWPCEHTPRDWKQCGSLETQTTASVRNRWIGTEVIVRKILRYTRPERSFFFEVLSELSTKTYTDFDSATCTSAGNRQTGTERNTWLWNFMRDDWVHRNCSWHIDLRRKD